MILVLAETSGRRASRRSVVGSPPGFFGWSRVGRCAPTCGDCGASWNARTAEPGGDHWRCGPGAGAATIEPLRLGHRSMGRDDLRDAVVGVLGDAERGVLSVDETGFLKKSVRSAGVGRQLRNSRSD